MPRAAQLFTRKELDDLTDFALQFGAKGLAWVKVKEDASLAVADSQVFL
jgi:aspartyl-tRNA synthetase